MKKRGVYAAAVIKKRRYWPKHVKGDDIKAAKVQQPLGTQSRLPGKYDNIPFDLFTSNEPDYVQIFMSTYGTINPKVNQKKYKGGMVEILLIFFIARLPQTTTSIEMLLTPTIQKDMMEVLSRVFLSKQPGIQTTGQIEYLRSS